MTSGQWNRSPSPLGSSPGLRRKLLMAELLNKTSAAPIKALSPEEERRTTIVLSQPKPYSPPLHRHIYRISGVVPATSLVRQTHSEELTGLKMTEDSQPLLTVSRSTFYAPRVIGPEDNVTPSEEGLVVRKPRAQSASPVLMDSAESREPEFV